MLRRIIAEFWSALSNAAAASEGASVISPMETGSQHLQRAPRASRCLCGNRRKGEILPRARPRAVPRNSAGRDPRLELGSSAVVPARGVLRSPGSGTELEPVKQLYLGYLKLGPEGQASRNVLEKEQRRSQKSQDVKIHFWKSPQESHLSAFLVTLKVGD